MSRTPAWVGAEPPRAEEEAGDRLRTDAAAERLHVHGLAGLSVDPERAAFELTAEQRALRGSRPKSRRWKALDKFDHAVDELQQRHGDAIARLQDAEQRLQQAPDADARTLAGWLAAGEQGDRPAATVYERERDRDAARLLVDAVTVELDQVLERRRAHIERHRRKMLADARRDVEDARARLQAKVEELPALRETLLAARETLLWVGAYPDPVESFGHPTAIALGLRKPVERTLSTRARVEFSAVIQVLEEDATALAEAYSAEQKRQLGTPVERTPLSAAMWDSDEDMVAWKRQELQRARELAEYGNAAQLAVEANDYRPDP